MALGAVSEEKAVAARSDSASAADDGAQLAPPPPTNVERAREATRRWMLAGMAGMSAAMLCSFTDALHLLSPWLESIAVFAGGWAVFASLRPKSLMQELEHDDRAAIALLARRAAAVAEGDRRIALQDLVLDRADDLGRLSRSLHDLAAEARANKHHARLMSRRIGHHVQRETFRATAHLQREALTDPLTGLGNRRALGWHVQRLIAAEGAQAPVTLMLVDVDRFKTINDTLGHGVGDRCLKFLAEVMRTCLRKRDVIVRLGGDEFLALMPGATADAARPAAQRLLGLFGQLAWSHALERPTLSVGLAGGVLGDLLEGGTLLERADAALYSAKRDGRARLATFADRQNAA